MSEKIYYKPTYADGYVQTDFTLIIDNSLSWSLKVYGHVVPHSCACLKHLPEVLTSEEIQNFCNTLKILKVCEGNQDFKDVLSHRIDIKEPFPGKSSDCVAFAETSMGHSQLIKSNFDVVRHISCEYVVDNDKDRCKQCASFRSNLYTIRTNLTKMNREEYTKDTSRTNLMHLTNSELILRLENTQNAKRRALREVAALSGTISKILTEESITINPDQNDIVGEIFHKQDPKLEEGTPMWLLWQQQMKQSSSNPKAMRWHPLIIRWCLSIYHISPAAYKQIASKRNKFLALPHVNTLKKYLNYTTPTVGFNPDVLKKLVIDSKLHSLEEFQKEVSLCFDEMKLQQGLVYQRSTGKLIGFCEMGDINHEIATFQASCFEELSDELKVAKNLAKYVNVFMVRGIFSNLESTIGYHASCGFTGDQLFPLVWEATRVLEVLGFKVRSWVCDGAAPNM